MEIEPSTLTGSTQQVLSKFIDHVTRSEDEIEQEEETGRRKTELKVFVAENLGFELGQLNEEISALAQTPNLHDNIKKYLDSHNFRESKINGESSYIEIETPRMGRTDQFVFVDDGDYLRIVTAERRKWTKKTVERLINYLPTLERIFLSPSNLQSVVKELDGASVSGFTAKYHSYDTDKRVSIRFHGGTDDDLETVKNEFGARPTRLEFSQENSPPDTIKSAIAQEGHYTFSSVRPGYEEKGLKTFNWLSEELERQDQQNFKVEFAPEKVRVGSGMAVDGFTTLELIEGASEEDDPRTTAEKLREDVLEYKNRYVYSSWEPGRYEVFDKNENESFEITVEGDTIRLHAKEGTSSASFRDFSEILYSSFNSTYHLQKTSRKLKA